MVDPDLELYGRQGAEGEGFVLLALPAFIPSANFSFFTQCTVRGAGPSPTSSNGPV